MSELPQAYRIIFCDEIEFPPHMMVGETVFDYDGKPLGWVAQVETCQMTLRYPNAEFAYIDVYECSKCGEEVYTPKVMGKSKPPRFCPGCGRIVE